MIINYLTNTDIYKFYMQQFFFDNYPEKHGIYKFHCRNEINLNFLYDDLIKEINHLCTLRFRDFELEYMKNMLFPDGNRVFGDYYLNYLKYFQFKRDDIHIHKTDKGLVIFTNGRIIDTTHYEIFVLKIIQELYWKKILTKEQFGLALIKGNDILESKIKLFKRYEEINNKKLNIVEFGGRRGFTTDWHDYDTKKLSDNNTIIGTSDLYLAIRNNIKPLGTMAHEYITFFQGIDGVFPEDSQLIALNQWISYYKGNLGVALSDTLTDKKFDIDFNPDLSYKYTGCRHDSGNPYLWGENRIKEYEKIGIDPKEKTLFFSDGLTPWEIINLDGWFMDKVNVVFGVGTNLTNDMGNPLGLKPLNNVMKLVNVDGNPVGKLSNSVGKTDIYDQKHLEKLRKSIKDY